MNGAAPRDRETLAAAVRWLQDCYRVPGGDLRARWEELGVASFPLGDCFEAVQVIRSVGRLAVEEMREAGARVGPVVENARSTAVAFLVPPGTRRWWDLDQTAVWGFGERLFLPRPGRSGYGRSWLVEPDGTGALTDALALLRALERAGARQRQTTYAAAWPVGQGARIGTARQRPQR